MVLKTNSKLIVGAALEGVDECLWVSDTCRSHVTKEMEFVISPSARGSEVLVGESAKTSRVDLGMPWPREARIDPETTCQRIPVPILWRNLVENRSGSTEWVSATNSRKHADMLAAHILSRLGEYENASQFFIAIPDQLSDFSQQRLLDAFSRKGKRNIRFIWTPVALALSWLDALGKSLAVKSSSSDYLLVLHFGAAGLNCTKFLLREKKFGQKTYICPVRSGNGNRANVDILDFIVKRVHDTLDSIGPTGKQSDLNANWFCLGVPEVWGVNTPERGVDSVLLHLAGSWVLSPIDLFEVSTPIHSQLGLELPIHALLEALSGKPRPELGQVSWGQLVDQLLESQLSDLEGSVRGVIVGGIPFVQESNSWSEHIARRMTEHMNSQVVANPAPNAIWSPLENTAAVASGAGVFGVRQQSGIPTYFDVLPYLGIHAQGEDPEDDQADGAFIPLIPLGSEAEGGRPYRPEPIRKKFALAQGQKELEAILEMEDQGQRTLRKTTFRFPRGPKDLMPLDVHVQVQSAGGLPTVEIIPEDSEFLGGVQVYLDWKSMERIEKDQLPKRALGWPPIRVPHRAIHPSDSLTGYNALKTVIRDFLGTPLGDRLYWGSLERLQRRLSTIMSVSNDGSPLRIVDVDGKSCSPDAERMISDLSKRLGEDYKTACEAIKSIDPQTRRIKEREVRRKFQKLKQKLITISTYLFGSTPKNIRKYVLHAHRYSGKYPYNLVHPSARVASTPEEIACFFNSMSESASDDDGSRYFKAYWLFAAKRILTSRRDACAYIDRDILIDIYEGLILDFVPWIKKGGHCIGVILQLLFYFLRFRRTNKTFLSSKEGDADDKYLHAELKKIIKQAKTYVDQESENWYQGRRNTTIQALHGLEEFIDYKGSANTLILLRQFDDDEDG